MSSTTTTTITSSTRASAVHVEQIQDENVLREMWMEAQDGESKRQIRSRMYKLREERLKDFYNREGVLENILNPTLEIIELDKNESSDKIMCTVGDKMLIASNNENGQPKRKQHHHQQHTVTKIQGTNAINDGGGKGGGGIISSTITTTTTTMGGIGKDGNYSNSKTGAVVARKTIVTESSTTTTSGTKSNRINTTKSSTTQSIGKSTTPKYSLMDKDTSTTTMTKSPGNQPRFMTATKSSEMGRQAKEQVITSSTHRGNESINTKNTMNKTGTTTKYNTDKMNKSRETSPKGRGQNVSTRDRISSSTVTKDKAEESIIRELDILDNYLSQRSTSIEEPINIIGKQQVNGLSESVNTARGKPKVKAEPVDVVTSGIEPPITKKIYKYDCPGDEHDHSHHDHSHHDKDKKSKTKEIQAVKSSANTTTSAIKSNIEDEIIFDTSEYEDRKVKNKGKVNARVSSPKPSRFKEPSSVKSNLNESQTQTTTDLSKGRTTRTTSTKVSETLSKQEKYETDILSRPSVFDKKSKKGRPEPNPRVRGSISDSSPERDAPQIHRIVKKDGAHWDKNDVDEDFNDDPLKPQARFGGQLESPGAVLKAKSLFETKATEASMDRSSGGFSPTGASFKVTRNAAIFEARSRGERVSISSESSSHAIEDIVKEADFEAKQDSIKHIDTSIRQAHHKFSDTTGRISPIKSADTTGRISPSKFSDTTRRTSQSKSTDITGRISPSKFVDTTGRTSPYKSTDITGRISPSKFVDTTGRTSPSRSTEINASTSNTKTVDTSVKRTNVKSVDTSIKTTQSKYVDTSVKTAESKFSDISVKKEKPKDPDTLMKLESTYQDDTHEKSESTKKKVVARSNSSILDAKVEAMINRSNKTVLSPTSTQKNITTTIETVCINYNIIEDIEELESFLKKATDYDERSRIRARIRTLKRKTNLEKSEESVEKPQSKNVTSGVTKNVNELTSQVTSTTSSKNTGASARLYTGRKSSDELYSLTTKTPRKGSAELTEIITRKISGLDSRKPGVPRSRESSPTSLKPMKTVDKEVSPTSTITKKYERRRSSRETTEISVAKTEDGRKISLDSGKPGKKYSGSSLDQPTRKHSNRKQSKEEDESCKRETTRRRASKESTTEITRKDKSPSPTPGGNDKINRRRTSKENTAEIIRKDKSPSPTPAGNDRITRRRTSQESTTEIVRKGKSPSPTPAGNDRITRRTSKENTTEIIHKGKSPSPTPGGNDRITRRRTSKENTTEIIRKGKSPSPTPGGNDKITRRRTSKETTPTPGGNDKITRRRTSKETTPTPGGNDKITRRRTSKETTNEIIRKNKPPSPTPGGNDKITRRRTSKETTSEIIRKHKSPSPTPGGNDKITRRRTSKETTSEIIRKHKSPSPTPGNNDKITRKFSNDKETSPPPNKTYTPTEIRSREPSAELYSTRRVSKEKKEDEPKHVELRSLIPRRSPSPDHKAFRQTEMTDVCLRRVSRDRTLQQKNSIEELLILEKQPSEKTDSNKMRRFSRERTSPPKIPKIEIPGKPVEGKDDELNILDKNELNILDKNESKISRFSREKFTKSKIKNDGQPESELINCSVIQRKLSDDQQQKIRDQSKFNTTMVTGSTNKNLNTTKTTTTTTSSEKRRLSEGTDETKTNISSKQRKVSPVCKTSSPEGGKPNKNLEEVPEPSTMKRYSYDRRNSSKEIKVIPDTQNKENSTGISNKVYKSQNSNIAVSTSTRGGGTFKLPTTIPTKSKPTEKTVTSSQVTDSVTSSYGIGPTDDDGTPLFGLRALRKIKQVQEQLTSSNTSNEVVASDQETYRYRSPGPKSEKSETNVRTSDMYGLRALRKNQEVVSETILTSDDQMDTDKGLYYTDERPGCAPKSILKKTSSFSSNKSDSKNEMDLIGLTTSTTASSTSSVSKTYGSTSGTTITDDWKKSSSPESSLSRGRVGRSSVREMSKKFESPGSTGTGDGGETSRTKISVVTKTSVRGGTELNAPEDSTGGTTKTTTITTTRIKKSGGTGRSFLTDTTPAQNLSDVFERMKGEESAVDDESGRNLLNKFIGSQILLQGVEPFVVTGSRLEDCDGDVERQRIETRLKTLEFGEKDVIKSGESRSMYKTSTKSSDVTGELMPLILGQLQNSLHSFSTFGGGNNTTRSTSGVFPNTENSSGRGGGGGNSSSSNSSHSNSSNTKEKGNSVNGEDSNEECLFDSGTESGEDVASCAPSTIKSSSSTKKKSSPPPAEFSTFMEGIRNSLRTAGRGGANEPSVGEYNISGSLPYKARTAAAVDRVTIPNTETDLLQQVDSVLSLLRDSLTKDPNFLVQKMASGSQVDPQRGNELVALIDRLKTSLPSSSSSSKEDYPLLPLLVGQGVENHGAGWLEPRPPDIQPHNEVSNKIVPREASSWIVKTNKCEIIDEAPWKVRAARKRSQIRSRSVGVSDEELAEARRCLQEEAFRSALKEGKTTAAKFLKEINKAIPESGADRTTTPQPRTWKSDIEKGLTSVPRPFVRISPGKIPDDPPTRRVSSVDDASFITGSFKLKPFRTFSLDNSCTKPPESTTVAEEIVSSPDAITYDPSVALFTPEEVVQIEIHKAAIKKQMSAEEDRRRIKNSLIWQPSLQSTPQTKEFTVGLPKPYALPKQVADATSNFNQQSSKPSRSASDQEKQTQICSEIQRVRNNSYSGSTGDHSILYDSSKSNSSTGTTSTITAIGNSSALQSPNRIENVQISLTELNSSEFPQLQIAITLNTNNSSGVTTTTSSGCTNQQSSSNNVIPTVAKMSFKPSNQETSSGIQSLSDNSDTCASASGMSAIMSTKAIRYKSKNERKKRMKRANTIDIPHPAGFLHSQEEEESEGDDEEESDTNTHGTNKNSAPPLAPKTDEERKFTSFLEKNKALEDSKVIRPAYLGVNDRQWNNRFSNLKTSFESSSQGSSPSASPIPSPGKTRSETALTPSQLTQDHYSKPVWTSAIADPGQMPSVVKNKLHVFETKSNNEPKLKTNMDHQWKSPVQPDAHHFPQPQRSSILTKKDNFEKLGEARPEMQMRNQTHIKPLPLPAQTHMQMNTQTRNLNNSVQIKDELPPLLPPKKQNKQQQQQQSPQQDGVHMIHATKSAIEAMQRSNYVPSSPPPAVPPRTSHPPQQLPLRPPPPEKIDLPWAKKETGQSTSEGPQRLVCLSDSGSARVQMSKALFEAKQTGSNSPPPVPPKPNKVSAFEPPCSVNSTYSTIKKPDYGNFTKILQKPEDRSSPSASPPCPSHVEHISGIFKPILVPSGEHNGQQSGRVQKLGVFGVTRSFDESFKQKLEPQQQQVSRIQFGVPVIPAKSHSSGAHTFGSNKSVETTGSAFARKEPAKLPQLIMGQQSISSSLSGDSDGMPSPTSTLIAPVVSKVMQGPQQQRAIMTRRDMSTLGEDHPSAHRITGARSNIRSILSNYQPETQSEDEFPSVPGQNGQTSLQIRSRIHHPPALTKSHSGDAIFKSHYKHKVSFPQPDPNQQRPLGQPAAIPKQKSFTEFAHVNRKTNENRNVVTSVQFPSKITSLPQQPIGLSSSSSVSMSTPSIPSAPKVSRSTAFPPTDSLKRASSGSSIFDRTKCLFISAQESGCAALAPKPRRKPPTLPRSMTLFPKQFEAQMSPETVDKKTKEVQAYFQPKQSSQKKNVQEQSLPQQHNQLFLKPIQPQLPPLKLQQIPKQQLQLKLQVPISNNNNQRFQQEQKAVVQQLQQQQKQQQKQQQQQQQEQQTSHAIQKYQQKQQGSSYGSRIRKSSSHGKLMHRQRSLSDGEEDVDKIFESLFKASVASKMIQSDDSDIDMITSKTSIQSLSQCQVEKTMKSSTSSPPTSSSSVSISQGKSSSSCSTSSSSSSFSSKTSSTTVGASSTTTTAISSSSSPFNKFKQLDQQTSNSTGGTPGGKPLFKFTSPALKTSASSAKEMLLYWCQCRTRDYKNINLENFSNSWSDGLAFCALIHHFYPDSFEYDILDSKNRRQNFELAFRIAEEKADIYPLLDVEDMMVMGSRPDWKCVFTYVQSMYRKLKDLS